MIIAPYLAQRRQIQDIISQLEGSEVYSPTEKIKTFESTLSSPDGSFAYNKDWRMPKKAHFVLSNAGRELSTAEVFELIINYEPELADKRALCLVLISDAFSYKAKAGRVYYRTGNRSGFKYGLLEWKQKEEAA